MKFIKDATVFTAGGLLYGLVEIAWRGTTHISMFAVGGLCFLIIGKLDDLIPNLCLLTQAVLSSVIITLIEFTSGVILNMVLQLGVWDYSDMPFDLFGQICLPFSILWFLISVPAVLLENAMRTVLFSEPKKHYALLRSPTRKETAKER